VKLATYSAKGVEYSFRSADPGDSSSIVKFYASMDPETIFMRFLSAYGNFEGHVRGIFPRRTRWGSCSWGRSGMQ